ncbi:MAG: hypothetical protein K6T17_05560, partial [Fimbriimonadales bacterium]|nr:hypothetical protein [Fimbriimonadales bacterium]
MWKLDVDQNTELKLLELKDAEILFALVDSCRPYLRQWLPWIDATQTVDNSRQFIEFGLQKFAANNGLEAGIWYKGQLAGVIGLHYIDRNNRK